MFTAVNGYYNGEHIVMDERVNLHVGQRVIITILDTMKSIQSEKNDTEDRKKAAAISLAGLWKNHDEDLSVEETVRAMRKGRSFDY